MAGLVEFFYNIIPGSYFLLVLLLITPESSMIKTDIVTSDLSLPYFITLSLLIGFILQAFNKQKFLDFLKQAPAKEIATNCNTSNAYLEATNRISKLISRTESDHLNNFYYMHNFLLSHKTNNELTFSHARIALWGNMAGANIFLLIGALTNRTLMTQAQSLFKIPDYVLLASLIFIAVMCYKLCSMYYQIFYDIVLREFLVTTDKQGKPL